MVYSENTSTTTLTIEGGYTLVPLSRVGNALGAFIAGLITLADIKAFFALLEMTAIRDAAECRGRTTGDRVCYEVGEIGSYVGPTGKVAPGVSIKRLQASNLLTFTPESVTFTDKPLPFADEIIDDLAGSRSPKRLIPTPRRVIRFLAACDQPAILKAIAAILIRGLTYKNGVIHLAGSYKSSWVASVVGISLRAAKYARKLLIKIGLISFDTGSTQRKLNRTGAYFVVNPTWRPICPQKSPEGRGEDESAPSGDELIATSENSCATLLSAGEGNYQSLAPEYEEPVLPPIREENEALPVDNSLLLDRDFAPLPPENCTEFAPPIEDKKPSKEGNKDQKPLPSALGSGVYKTELKNSSVISLTPPMQPKLHAIEEIDLKHFPRCELLYWQAVEQGWIEHNEMTALNWVGASVRAREVARTKGGASVRIFVTLVRKRLWGHITNEQEDYARQTLAKFRDQDSGYFRVKPVDRSSKGSPGEGTTASGVPRALRTIVEGFSKAGNCLSNLMNLVSNSG